MTRKITGKRVAILATGDEIISGDILNTNARQIALTLNHHHILTGTQMVVADDIHDIEHAIRDLLASHESLIITGGLGPTSDDLTRFALSKALNQPLVLNEPVWESIVARLRRLGYADPPQSNQQQALFPAHADIIHNHAGTAAGCTLIDHDKIIFMLPGPPYECLPMIDSTVLPTLKNAQFNQTLFRQHWLLFGVSEGQVAEKLDKIAFSHQCMTGYRLSYPYVECKLYAENETCFLRALPDIQAIIAPYLTGNGQQTASEWLRDKLQINKKKLTIQDHATGGLLEHTLRTPLNTDYLHFNTQNVSPDIVIHGLAEYWTSQNTPRTTLSISFPSLTDQAEIIGDIPFREERVKPYAVEWICRTIGQVFKF